MSTLTLTLLIAASNPRLKYLARYIFKAMCTLHTETFSGCWFFPPGSQVLIFTSFDPHHFPPDDIREKWGWSGEGFNFPSVATFGTLSLNYRLGYGIDRTNAAVAQSASSLAALWPLSFPSLTRVHFVFFGGHLARFGLVFFEPPDPSMDPSGSLIGLMQGNPQLFGYLQSRPNPPSPQVDTLLLRKFPTVGHLRVGC